MKKGNENQVIKPGKWFAEFDEMGNCTRVEYDSSYRDILGYHSEEEYRNAEESWFSSFHPDDEERINKYYEYVLEKHPEGLDYDIEYRRMTKFGYRWFHDYGHCVRREDGSIIRCDGVIFDIQDIMEKDEEHKLLLKNNARILALEDSFESLYDVELDTGKYSVYVNGETYKEEIDNKLLEINEYFSDLRKNIDIVVYPEDRDGLYNVLTKESIRKELSDKKSFDYYYRVMVKDRFLWFKIRIAYKDSEKKNIIIGVFNAEAEMAKKKKEELLRNELISQMVGNDGLFLIDCVNDTRRTVKDKTDGAAKYSDKDNYSELFRKYVEDYVAPSDVKMMRRFIDPVYLLKLTDIEREYTVQYRDTTTGIQRFYEMKLARFSDTEVLQSFKEKDKEIVERMILDKLEDGYFAFLVLDVDAGLTQVIKNGTVLLEKEGEVADHKTLMDNLSVHFEGETKDFISNLGNVQALSQRLEKEDKVTYSYRSSLEDGSKWASITQLVLTRHENKTPAMIAIGFSFLDEEATEKEELQLRIGEALDVVGGLATEYTALYHIDLSSGVYKVFQATDRISDMSASFSMFPKYIDMLSFFVNSDAVHPDYKQKILDFYGDDDNIRKKLRYRKKISMLFLRKYGMEYLWTELNVVKCEDVNARANNIIVGFIEKDDEVRHEKEAEQRKKEAENVDKMVNSIVSSYDISFRANIATEKFTTLRMFSKALIKDKKFNKFSEQATFFIDNIVHPSDRDFLRNELDYETVKSKLKIDSSYSVEYRSLIQGITFWNRMTITSLTGEEILVSIRNENIEITKRRLENKRYGEYLALFSVDVVTSMIQPIITSDLFKTANVGEAVPYSEAMKIFSNIYSGEVKEFFERISNIEHMKREFAVDDKRTFSYKSSKMGTDKWIDVCAYVIKRGVDHTPEMLTIGFALVDTFATARQEVQARLKEDMVMIGGLAREYHVLFYYNIVEDSMKTYALDEQLFPELAKNADEMKNPFDGYRQFAMYEMVHPDDRIFFDYLSLEKIMEKLAHNKKYTIRFRRLYQDEYRWTELELIKYEDVDEEPKAIAMGFADRDDAIRSEQVISNCFEVLGKEMAPEEAINKMITNIGEYYDADRCYIFEYSQTRVLINNTYEWCNEDTEPMITELQNIAATEVEGWVRQFMRQGAFFMDSLDDIDAYGTKEGKELLQMQNIQSIIAAPIMNGPVIVGFIGLDNPKKAKRELNVIKKLSIVIYSEILKRKENDEEHTTLVKLADTFVSVYYADLSNDYLHTWKIDDDYKDVYGSAKHYSESMGGYVRHNIAVRDRERCIQMTSPEYVLDQFKTKEKFSIDMTDIMLGYERDFVFDYIKVNKDGSKFVMCCRDVTDTIIKEKEQQKLLDNARIAAEAASKSKSSFLFNMSHDIRTPMNAIVGFTNMAKKYIDDKSRLNDYLDKIDTSGLQLLALVNQVLEMARIESGKIEIEENQVNVQEEYNTMITVLSEQAETNGLIFKHSIDDIVHTRVLADKARVSSITLNISGNSMKYTPAGGTIEFRLKEIEPRKEGYATFVFTVSDTGIGMSEEYLKVLYEPFTREKSSTVSKIQGTGLGMSIVKDLVDLMEGDIQVDSVEGKGTTFVVTLDFKIDTSTQSANGTRLSSGKASFEGYKALLVEDNEMNREIAVDILTDEGIIIEEAEDGTVAIEKIKQRGPEYYDFVLMDIQMPIMNGYDATKIIRDMYPNSKLPIIALSANAFSEDREASLASGMNDHVAKPINPTELFRVLAKYC